MNMKNSQFLLIRSWSLWWISFFFFFGGGEGFFVCLFAYWGFLVCFVLLYKRFEWVWVKVAESCPTLCDPMDCIVHGIHPLEWVAFPFSRRSSQPRDQTQVSHIAGGFFTSWIIRVTKNSGVGILSLLQWIFLTQKLNQGLLHCRWILYQLSYEESPIKGLSIGK